MFIVVAFISVTVIAVGFAWPFVGGTFFCPTATVPAAPPTACPVPAYNEDLIELAPGSVCTAAVGEICTTNAQPCGLFGMGNCTQTQHSVSGKCTCSCKYSGLPH